MNNETLAQRVDLLVVRIRELEKQVQSLTVSQGGEIPAGMLPLATLAAEYGISTRKGEELAKNTGVMLVKMKSGGYIAHADKFREAARRVLRAAKRKYGSAFWYHPALGKFQMSGGIPE